jgi:hypothetical protein
MQLHEQIASSGIVLPTTTDQKGIGSGTSRSHDPQNFSVSTGDTNGHTAASLPLVHRDITDYPITVTARPALIPNDVGPPQFSIAMINLLLATMLLTCDMSHARPRTPATTPRNSDR